MEENNPQNPPSVTADLPVTPHTSFHASTIVGIIVVSLIFGVAGGVYGALSLAKNPGLQKFFASPGSPAGISQNLVLDEQSATVDVVKAATPSVVSIVISKDVSKIPQLTPFGFIPRNSTQPNIQEIGAGSGFFISSDGLILTNKHVVADTTASYRVITSEGKSYDAKVLSMDPVNDLAIIKIDASGMKALSFADSSKLELGEHVVAIGNSLGQYQNTVTSGIISGIGRSIVAGDQTSSEQLEGVIQTDAAINPGNSGGPLLNLAGAVVGINTATDQQGQSVGFAIPANDASAAVDSYRQHGKIVRPYLGVRYLNITKAIAESEKLPKDTGALLIRGQTTTDFAVMPNSPADRAGLKENDIILSINGKDIDDNNSLAALLKSYQPGDTISMKVFSGGSEKTVSVTLGETK